MNVDTKVCNKCKQQLNLSIDVFRRLSSGYWSSQCRQCEYATNRKWYQANKEKHHQLVKDWKRRNPEKNRDIRKKVYDKNRESVLQQKKEYRNRPEVKERRHEYDRTKRKTDVTYRVRMNVSRAVNDALRRQNSNKRGQSVWSVLGYSPKELAQHIENQWAPWMNWDNHGIYRRGERKWHIDHIIPQSDLPYDSMDHPNFKKCWALENLRPLEAVRNISEGNRRTDG